MVGRKLRLGHAERRARSDALPPPFGAAPLLLGMQRALAEELGSLDAAGGRVGRAWRPLLRSLKPSRDEYDALAALDLAGWYRLATEARDRYAAAVEASARELSRAGVPEQHALAAVALYLEACLPWLGAGQGRGLARVTAETQRLVARAYGEERGAGLRGLEDRERQKLASDLHDEVGADLVVLKMYVESIAAELSKGNVGVGPKLEEALVLISHAIESVRRLTLDLGPAFLEALGFLPALRSFVRQFSRRTGIRVELQEPRAPLALPSGHETALYRVLRGALSNVAKHSGAARASVALAASGGTLTMSVEDDGRGFEPGGQVAQKGFGLAAMRDRIRELGGRLSVESRVAKLPGERSGTRLLVRLPLAAEEVA